LAIDPPPVEIDTRVVWLAARSWMYTSSASLVSFESNPTGVTNATR